MEDNRKIAVVGGQVCECLKVRVVEFVFFLGGGVHRKYYDTVFFIIINN